MFFWQFQSTRLSRASTSFQTQQNRNNSDFNPQGSHEPRHVPPPNPPSNGGISIHKALTSLDSMSHNGMKQCLYFNPQGSHEPRREADEGNVRAQMISIHKALTSLDCTPSVVPQKLQRFQSTRLSRASTMNFFRFSFGLSNFNPQGSHEPRLTSGLQHTNLVIFQSTRLSRAST